MAGLNKTGFAPLPGDPWRASEHNAIVDQSVALETVVTHEHGDAGDHAALRFAAAGGVARWTGSAWSLPRSSGIASISGPATMPKVVLSRPMRTAAEWGVIGQSFNGLAIDMIQAGKTASEGVIRVTGTEFFFFVVGPHAPL